MKEEEKIKLPKQIEIGVDVFKKIEKGIYRKVI